MSILNGQNTVKSILPIAIMIIAIGRVAQSGKRLLLMLRRCGMGGGTELFRAKALLSGAVRLAVRFVTMQDITILNTAPTAAR